MLRKLAVLLSVLCGPAFCDEISDLAQTEALIGARLAVEVKQAALLKQQGENTTKQLSITDDLLKVEDNKRKLALARMKQTVTKVVIVGGTVHPADNPALSCDATAFLQFSCGDPKEDCSFDVNKDICGTPASSATPLVITGQYRCGSKEKTFYAPFGAKAFLTCKVY